MSLYNMLFGTNPNTDFLLAALGIDKDKIPRFRDCFIDEGRIVIHTRTGGGNRDYYESEESCRDNYPEYFGDDPPTGPWNEDLRALPTFIMDEDDDFDSTYANFYFECPAEVKILGNRMGTIGDVPPADKWRTLLADLEADTKTPESQRALEMGKRIIEQIADGETNITI